MYSCRCGNVVVHTRGDGAPVASKEQDSVLAGMRRVELGLGGVHVGFAPLVVCSALRNGWRIYNCGNVRCGMRLFALPEGEGEFEMPIRGRGALQMPSTRLMITNDLLSGEKLKQPEEDADYCKTFRMVLPQASSLSGLNDMPSKSNKTILQMVDSIITEGISNEKLLMEQRIASFITSEREKLKQVESVAKGDKLRLLKTLQDRAAQPTLTSALSDAMTPTVSGSCDVFPGDERANGSSVTKLSSSVGDNAEEDTAETHVNNERWFRRKSTSHSRDNQRTSRGSRVSIGGVTTINASPNPATPALDRPSSGSPKRSTKKGERNKEYRHSGGSRSERRSGVFSEDVFGMDGIGSAFDAGKDDTAEGATENDATDDDEVVTGRHSSTRRGSRDNLEAVVESSLAKSVPISVPMQRRSFPLNDLESDGESDYHDNHIHVGDDDTARLAKSFADASMMAQINDSTSIFGEMPQSNNSRRRGFTFHT